MLIKNKITKFRNRVYETLNGIFLPDQGLVIPKKNMNILAILENEMGKSLFAAHNIVTTAGDVYYGQKATGASPTNTFANLYLIANTWAATHPQKSTTSTNTNSSATAISGSSKAVSSTYPKVSDGDSDNTGSGPAVVTWAFSYTKGDFNATGIQAGAIAASGVTFGSTGAPLLTAFSITSFDKTANDTLKVFVNHTMLGV